MTIYGIYSVHHRYWQREGLVWYTKHLNLAHAQCEQVRGEQRSQSWEVCAIGKYGRPAEVEEEFAE